MKHCVICAFLTLTVANGVAGTLRLVAGATEPINQPFGVGVGRDGIIYGVECKKSDGRVFSIGPESGIVTFIAEADFNALHDLAVARNGDIFLADTHNYRVCRIDSKTGVCSTIAGTGTKGFSGDGGPALEAQLGGIYACALDQDERNLFLADLHNRRIRKIALDTGIITTVAGDGTKEQPQDGTIATKAPLPSPRAVTVDTEGRLFIVSRAGHALRMVDLDGRIQTPINSAGNKGYGGDGNDALLAKLNGPKQACIDPQENILIADAENHVIRKYFPKTGTIELVAGMPGIKGRNLSADPLKTKLNRPHGICVDPSGRIYIADSDNHRILVIDP